MLRCRTLFAAVLLALPVQSAHADLTPGDISVIQIQKGLRVLSSDGAVIGVADGISVRNDRARLFLRARGGSIFKVGGGGKDIVVTTYTDKLTLRGNDLVLDANKQKVRNGANMSFTDDSSPIEIVLFGRR